MCHVIAAVVVLVAAVVVFFTYFLWGRGEHGTPSIILVPVSPSFKIP